MTPEQWGCIKETFEACREVPTSEWGGILDRLTADDTYVRGEVLSLLDAYHAGESTLDRPMAATAASVLVDALKPRRVGDYHLTRVLGEGGMGVVYEATDTRSHRCVAVKVAKTGFRADKHLIARFLRETQIIERLRHDNISKFVDSGTTLEGFPWLAMEFIEGEPVTDYCRSHGLDIEARVRLFRDICGAVQYAHEQSVLHRDIKPSNVLVTEAGVPKLLDFGIARIGDLDGSWTEDTTRTQSRLLTPDYASPEQLSGGKVTPSSDVFSLGVLLYELLTEGRPFMADARSDPNLLHARYATDPVQPSRSVLNGKHNEARTRFDDLGRRRGRGLDAIVLKTLRKNPLERYQTVAQLDDDLSAWLGHRQVRGIRDARWYSVRRKIGRHSLALALTGFLLLALASFALWRVKKPTADALPERASWRASVALLGFRNLSGNAEFAWVSTALSEMLSTELLEAESFRVLPGDETARLASDMQLTPEDQYSKRTAERIAKMSGTRYVLTGSYVALGSGSTGTLRVDWRLQDTRNGSVRTVAITQGQLSELPSMASKAGQRLRAILGGSSAASGAAVAVSKPNLDALRYYSEGLDKWRRYDALDAKELFERATKADPSNALARAALGGTLINLGYDPAAAAEAKKALELSTSLPREQRLLTRAAANEILRNWKGAVDDYGALWGYFSDNPEYGLALARAQASWGQPKEALDTISKLRGLSGSPAADPRIDLAEAFTYEETGEPIKELSAAKRAELKSRQLRARLLLGEALYYEGRSYVNVNDFANAAKCYREGQQVFREVGHRRRVADLKNVEAVALWNSGQMEPAKTIFTSLISESHQLGCRALEQSVRVNLANLLKDEDQFDEARTNFEAALTLAQETGVRTRVPMTQTGLADIARLQGHLDEAVKRYEKAIASAEEIDRPSSIAVANLNLGDVLYLQARLPEARARYERALALTRKLQRPNLIASTLVSMAALDIAQDQLTRARAEGSEALALAQKTGAKPEDGYALTTLANLDYVEGRYHEAEGEARRAAAEFHKQKQPGDEAEALSVLALIELKVDRLAEAVAASKEAVQLAGLNPEPQTALMVNMNAAVIRAAAGERPEPLKSLREIARRAEQLKDVTIAFESRLAQLEWDPARSSVQVRALAEKARKQGLLLIARQASELRPQNK